MSSQAIVEKIRTDAETEAKEIITQAEAQVSQINQDTDKKISDIKAVLVADFQKKANQYEMVTRSLLKQKINLASQVNKRNLLNAVYDQALADLLSLTTVDYVTVLTKRYQAILPKEIKVVEILAPENRQAETATIAKNLELSAPILATNRIKGGCILVGQDFEFDLSLEKLFAEARFASEIEMAKTLFQK